MSVETDRLVGTDLAGYRLESVLGRGGMGVVYLATDLRLERRVALKLIAPELAADPRFSERFLRESRLAASLDHSHIVPVYGAGETDGKLWLAMRYVQGTDLKTLLERDGALEPARAVELCSQIGEALDAAHAHGLVHRDVKPANVLVTQEGGDEHCYLADFGLARTADLEAGAGTAAHLSGTVDYTAPEQIAAEPADQRSDVYSLGCVLYECLAGEPPFKRSRPVATVFAHASEPPPSLHARRPELPEAVDEVTAKALAKDPEERYDTCRELCQAAETALGLGRPRFTRRRILLAATGAAIAIAAAAAVPAVLLGGGSTGRAAEPGVPLPLTEDSLVRIDAATSDVVEAISLGSTADALAVGDGSVWVASARERVLAQIDPRTNTVLNEVDVSPASPGFLAAGEGSVWVGRVDSLGKLWKYDPRTAALSEVPDIAPLGVATGEGAVWVPASPKAVVKISPTTGEAVSTTQVATAEQCACFPGLIAVGEGSVWVVGGPERPDTVWQIDADTGKVIAEIKLGFATTAIAAGTGAAWVTNPDDDSIARIDPSIGQVAQTIRVGRIPSSVAVADGFVWVASARDGSVTRVNPDTADVETIDVGGTPTDIAVGPGAVWVAVDVR